VATRLIIQSFLLIVLTILVACNGDAKPPFLHSDSEGRAQPRSDSFSSELNQSKNPTFSPGVPEKNSEGGQLTNDERKSLDKLLSDLGRS